ncbi:hypothetical protein INR49_007613 [Caranx melampygus]|nr:hypothetical protein INR49_007613 [Caranx melampygus]
MTKTSTLSLAERLTTANLSQHPVCFVCHFSQHLTSLSCLIQPVLYITCVVLS